MADAVPTDRARATELCQLYNEGPMTPRQELFVLEYLIDLNATRAAIRAGYSLRNAKAQGCALLRRSDVAEAIRQAMAERARRTGITAERVLEEFARIAFLDLRLIVEWEQDNAYGEKSTAAGDDAATAFAFLADLTQRRRGDAIFETLEDRKAMECLGRVLGLNLIEARHGATPDA